MYLQLIGNILLGILVVVNIPAPFSGLKFESEGSTQRLPFEPPGWFIPIVWFILFTIPGLPRYLPSRQTNHQVQGYGIIALAVLCSTYAYHTLEPSQPKPHFRALVWIMG